MLYDRVEDIASAQGEAIRFILGAVSKNTVQTTLTTLEQFCTRSVEFYRYTIKCTCTALLANRSDERALLAAKLVNDALGKPNGLTLTACALDGSASTLTKSSLTVLMTNDLKLTPMKQMQMAMALVLGGNAMVKTAATDMLEDFNVPQAALKEDDGGVRAAALLFRQVGLASAKLDSQLASLCHTSSLPKPKMSTKPRVSIAGILRELGLGCVTTLADSRELLSIFPHSFTERDGAEVLAFFASGVATANDSNTYASLMTAAGKSSPKSLSTATLVNAMPLLDALCESNPKKAFDWDLVIRLLDQADGEPFRVKHISVIFDAYHRFQVDSEYPSVAIFLGRWTNTLRQRGLLEYILRHPDKVNRKPLTMDAPSELLPTTKPPGVTASEIELWRSAAFMEAAVHVASRDKEFDHDVFRPAAEKLPLLFLYNLLTGSYTGTIKHLVSVKHLLKSHCPSLDPVAQHIVPEMEKRGRLDAVIGVLSELTETAPERTVDIVQMVLKCKSAAKRVLTESGSPRLVTAVAMCMDEAGEPSDKWLQRALEGKLHFRASSTENRFAVALNVVEIAEALQEKQVYVASATAALNALLASPLRDVLKSVTDCAKTLLASTDSLFPEDVENEATEFFKKMYAVGSTAAAIATVERLLKSTVPRDKQLYACIVSIMFDETSAIAYYPRKELQLFAELYGQMLAKDLLPPNQVQRAWGVLLPALAKPGNYATEEYGIIAVEQVKSRLPDWPSVGRALRHLRDLDFRVPGIKAAIYRGIKQEEEAARNNGAEMSDGSPNSPTSPRLPSSPNKGLATLDPAIVTAASSQSKKFTDMAAAKLHTLDIGTLVTNSNVTAPPRVIQEQINFLIGNTDVRNLDNNATELSQLLRPEYYEYFADYLVVKRAALEPNYHSMYIDLITKLHSKDLYRALRDATIAAVRRLLTSEKIGTDSSERILLRNLGSWLGSITLEKNIPILRQDLNFKELLCQSMREGRLVPAVSLMTRVLMSCAKSRFFCPPNPWTMAQLTLLMEMYNLPHLRVTLRFELELLLKALDQTLQDVVQYMMRHPSHATTEKHLIDVYKQIDISNSPDFRLDDDDTGIITAAPIPQLPQQPPMQQQQQQPTSSSPPAQQSSLRSSARPLQANAEPFQPKDKSPSALSDYDRMMLLLNRPIRPAALITPETVHLPSGDASSDALAQRLTSVRPQIAATLQAVVDEAVSYCMQRSVAIATRTTERLVLKDYARDPFPDDILVAGDGMARSLASSLSYVMVREELPMLLQRSFTNLVERIFEPMTPVDFKVVVRDAIVASNQELCMRAVEYSVGEEAAMATSRSLFDVAREKANTFAAGEPLPLPADQVEAAELLRVMGDALVPSGRMPGPQRQVYDDFYNCVPPVAVFTTVLRSLEEAVSRYLTGGNALGLNFAQLEAASAEAAANGASDEPQSAIRQHLARLLSLVSPETAVLYLSPMFNRLFSLAVSMDRLNKKANASANSHNNDNQQGGGGAVAANPDGTQNSSEDDPAWRQEVLRVSAGMHQLYLFVLLRCRERGGEAVPEEFTRLLLHSEHCFAFPKLATDLMRIKILSCSRFDEALAKALATGTSGYVTFAGDIITDVIIKEKLVASKDMRRTLSALDTIARTRTRAPAPTAPAHTFPSYVTEPPLSKIVPANITKLVVPCTSVGADEDEAFHKDVEQLMNDWISVWSQKSHRYTERRIPSVEFVKTLQHKRMLDTVHLHTFLGLGVRYCVEYYANTMLAMERADGSITDEVLVGNRPGGPPGYRTPYTAKCFVMCDGFVELVMVLLQCCSLRNESSHDLRAETTLLKRLLDAVTRVLTEHHDYVAKVRPAPDWKLSADAQFIPVFQQQPYVRLLSDLVYSLHRLESSTSRPMSTEFTMVFHAFLRRVHPLEYPGFTFGWIEILSHRFFIPRFMQQESTWDHYADLLNGAMLFVKFLIKGNRISPNGLVYYKTVFKLVLVLLHDYPQFLIGQHYPLCEAIPLSCVQLLNTVLCSFPPEQRLPEPFQHVDSNSPAMLQQLDTRVQETCIKATFTAANMDAQLLSSLEAMVRNDDSPVRESVLMEVLAKLTEPSAKRSLINAVAQHMAIVYLNSHNQRIPPQFADSNVLACYRFLCSRLNTKRRYYLLGACANQLRYPNIQTNFFSNVVLNLFLPSLMVDMQTQTCVQEQITRVLAEKTIIVQPHPWGVLNTFVELMREPKYNFWETSFIHYPMLDSVFTKLHRTVEARNGNAAVSNGAGSPAAAGTAGANVVRK
ncbi:hypothetical protein ABB37_06376 [Leptomonas pyrrhocoris]|uniref:CCR4-NOT transcription complex subunit 1 n=1 Tax=Leptomonas pyrrhocoris TaxID=157538 RepID=A0A0M9FXP3_LEPPY|nr:hypothetical protein ABB37_06376 [Leptomonas pyrrhocoris]KPA78215.1 hypothetical protein ABB37_06376 [Leptomonas pyrrhocoris]|eukprot:XP_015656654.1 hypothetical protein ABB37_06376 [Leptomonas pyrrhocoris]